MIELFLDSGAFSAKAQSTTINLDEYIAFLKEYKKLIDIYANLDVIGNPEKTWENQLKMEKAGLHPIPTFHYGEDFKWLTTYLKKYDYIALGGAVGKNTEDRCSWLDKCFSEYICDKNGMPRVKVHGFGISAIPVVCRYPWYSVDSTTWVTISRMGAIMVPGFRDGRYSYAGESIWKVSVSTRSPSRKEDGEHISTFSPLVKQKVLEYIHSKGYKLGSSKFRLEDASYELDEKHERWCGKELESGKREVEYIVELGISNEYIQRDELNIIFFNDLEKHLPEWPWSFKAKESRKGFGL